MREFILRAQKAKSSGNLDLNNLPSEGRMDLVCRCVSNALFISNDLRRDTIIHVVLEGPKHPPKVISFSGATLKGFYFDERNISKIIDKALKKGVSLKMGESVNVQEGIAISKQSFEGLVKEKAQNSKLYYLHKKGTEIESVNFPEDVCFIFGDYIGIPKKTEKFLDNKGAEKLKLSNIMLFASHCIVLCHNALDK